MSKFTRTLPSVIQIHVGGHYFDYSPIKKLFVLTMGLINRYVEILWIFPTRTLALYS